MRRRTLRSLNRMSQWKNSQIYKNQQREFYHNIQKRVKREHLGQTVEAAQLILKEVQKNFATYEKVDEQHKRLIRKVENLYHDSPLKQQRKSVDPGKSGARKESGFKKFRMSATKLQTDSFDLYGLRREGDQMTNKVDARTMLVMSKLNKSLNSEDAGEALERVNRTIDTTLDFIKN